MRAISDSLKSKLNSDKGLQITHKILLYRRKWNGTIYELDETPLNITDLLSYEGTNVTLNQQLDVDSANTWKVGNLILTLFNDNNCFWEGKDDGLFPSPYSLYGSKIEYYLGDITTVDYIKQFTGYLTSAPTYRQDSNLIDIQVLNRLDFLKTVSAESVSTEVVDENATQEDSSHVITANSAVGRIKKVLKGSSVSASIELNEEVDYFVSQLNNYNLGAILELSSDLLTGENIYITYIYWRKGIMIDALVEELLEVAGIDESHRIIEPVIFSNAVRIARTDFSPVAWAWIYAIGTDTFTHTVSGGGGGENTYTQYIYNPASHTYPATKYINCKCNSGRFRFKVDVLTDFSGAQLVEGGCALMSGASAVLNLRFGGAGASSNWDDIYIGKAGVFTKIGDGVVGYTFELEYKADGEVNVYRNDTLLYTTTTTASLNISEVRVFTGYSSCRFEVSDIAARPIDDTVYKTSPYIRIQDAGLGEAFIGFDRFNTAVNTTGTPVLAYQVRYKNGAEDWTEYSAYTIGTAFLSGYDNIEITIANTAAFGNKADFSLSRLWSFTKQDIPLGVCDLTDMSVFEAIEELAIMSMYEIGFDADDKFFFRARTQTKTPEVLNDDRIIKVPAVAYNLDRLKTRVLVGYGNFNKILDCNTQGEEHPNNLDKYGIRPHEINGGQLLPTDNVDLAYAIAPTVYAELSVLRLMITVEIRLNLELELGDFVQIFHNNNLLVKPNFSDFTKWQKLGIYGKKCKIEGIRTNYNKRTTTLTLTDYTPVSEIPEPIMLEFPYEMMMEFKNAL